MPRISFVYSGILIIKTIKVMSTQKMFVVENGVTGEWIGWFPTEEHAFARLNYIVGGG